MPRPLEPTEPTHIDQYQLVKVLGEGGQGVVYLAHDAAELEVAIKVLPVSAAADPKARRRLLREAEVADQLAPFCTARILDVGMLGARPYIVSEYIPGPSLQDLIAAHGPRSGGGLHRLAVTTLTTLAAIHRAGILHQDLKPPNVIMGPEGPVVIDFGISRIVEQATTRSGPIGTPAYMPPEILNGGPASAASDVFAWAATMIYAATGHLAFPGPHPAASMAAIVNGKPDLSGLPEEMRHLLSDCLAQNPGQRPTVSDLLDRLTGQSDPATTLDSGRRASPTHSPTPAPNDTPSIPPRGGTQAPAPRDDLDPDQRVWPRKSRPPSAAPAASAGEELRPGVPANDGDRTERPPQPVADHEPFGPARQSRGWTRRTILLIGGSTAIAGAAALTLPNWLRNLGEPAPSPTPTAPIGVALSQPFTGHTSTVRSVAFGQVGDTPVVVSGSVDKTVRVWDLSTGKQRGKALTGHTSFVNSVAFGRLGDMPIVISGSDDKTVRVWDLSTGKQRGKALTGHTGPLTDDFYSVAFGQLGGTPIAVSGSNEAVRVWDLATGKQRGKALTGHTDFVGSVAFGRLGDTPIVVSGSNDGTVRVWDLTTGKQHGKALDVYRLGVGSVAFGQLGDTPIVISGSVDKTVRVWDLSTGQQHGKALTGHTDSVDSVAFGQLGDMPIAISGSADKTMRVWSLG